MRTKTIYITRDGVNAHWKKNFNDLKRGRFLLVTVEALGSKLRSGEYKVNLARKRPRFCGWSITMYLLERDKYCSVYYAREWGREVHLCNEELRTIFRLSLPKRIYVKFEKMI